MIAFQILLIHDIEIYDCTARKFYYLIARSNGYIQRLVIVRQYRSIPFGIAVDVYNAGMIVIRHRFPAIHHVGITQILHSHPLNAPALMFE